jgi:hypothetical protein
MPCELDSTMLTTRERCAELPASCSDVGVMLNRVEMSTSGTAGIGGAGTAAAAAFGLVSPPGAELRAVAAPPESIAAALIPASTAESLTASSSLLAFIMPLLLLFEPLLLLLLPVIMVPLQVTVPTLKSPTGILSASE